MGKRLWTKKVDPNSQFLTSFVFFVRKEIFKDQFCFLKRKGCTSDYKIKWSNGRGKERNKSKKNSLKFYYLSPNLL